MNAAKATKRPTIFMIPQPSAWSFLDVPRRDSATLAARLR
jgi:hypothetical protein